MEYATKYRKTEIFVYLIIWLVILVMPVLLDSNPSTDWRRVKLEWVRIMPYALVFGIHNFLLFPVFFQKKKYLFYVLASIVLIVLSGYLIASFGEVMRPKILDLELHGHRPGPPHGVTEEVWQREFGPGPRMGAKDSRKMMFIDRTISSFMVIAFNLAILLVVRRQDDQNRMQNLEKQSLKTELAFLKTQISPHFFMNTLNNIHALIDINSEDAKHSVIRLSKLMRYLLYDSDGERTTLTKEIEFIKSYIELMRLRFTEKVKVELSFPDEIPDVKVPPLLFTSLLENAFKHGVSYRAESFIELTVQVEEKYLNFNIKNSKNQNEEKIESQGGIGLENLQKRLELLYAGKFFFEKNENDNFFEIKIKLPINE